jgi:hypothetical protein
MGNVDDDPFDRWAVMDPRRGNGLMRRAKSKGRAADEVGIVAGG